MTTTALTGPITERDGWTAVCRVVDLVPERGAAALVQGCQVALFRLHPAAAATDGGSHDGPGAEVVLAVQNLDPFSGAHVISRGIVGSRGEVPTVASPMYKQVFDLRTGRCLDAVGREPQHLRTWPVRVEDGLVMVAAEPDDGGHAGPGAP